MTHCSLGREVMGKSLHAVRCMHLPTCSDGARVCSWPGTPVRCTAAILSVM